MYPHRAACGAGCKHGFGGYPLNRWAAMIRYCDDGLLEISNNLVENALRGVALGRRNWMFVGSTKGGDASALFYSLVETCRLNGVETERWFTDVIERIGNHPINRIDELLPWKWQAARKIQNLEHAV
ncbi:transposase domain-containing protein [Novosphingobium sp. G106]|uniref:transposase domain-containing protein n=1 Tax=Novosphingobium sp. G106 TaxID=2849500 RepID=UPI0028127F48|nr:transposase domain-containing protein [Novosphingobium sp. G106]